MGHDTQHPRPYDREYYERVRALSATAETTGRAEFAEAGPILVDVAAGAAVTITLLAGAQIVNLFPFNTHDPDERLWAHETCLLEGLWTTRWSRLWGGMARFRPLLACLEDTVVLPRRPGEAGSRHHPVYGGGGTPAEWRWAGGAPGVMTTWEQFAAGLATRDLPPTLIKDNACLFQKTRLDAYGQRFEILPSDARVGDSITFFAELDVTLMLALSPYVDGSRPASELAGAGVRPIGVSWTAPLADPLGWPYPDMGYPDMSLYLDDTGTRSTEAVPTLGREAVL